MAFVIVTMAFQEKVVVSFNTMAGAYNINHTNECLNCG